MNRRAIAATLCSLACAAPVASAATLSPYFKGLPTGRLSKLNKLARARGGANRYVLLIHGGSFKVTGIVSDGTWWNAHGYSTYSIDYRPGYLSLPDTVRAYDHLRARVGPRAVVCADGVSAGGTLALLLAELRPSLNCVISEVAPTNLYAQFPSFERILASALPGRLWEYSPVRLGYRITQPVLMFAALNDPYVEEPAQFVQMHKTDPAAMEVLLDSAPSQPGVWANFTHSSITPAAFSMYHSLVLSFLAEARMESRRATIGVAAQP